MTGFRHDTLKGRPINGNVVVKTIESMDIEELLIVSTQQVLVIFSDTCIIGNELPLEVASTSSVSVHMAGDYPERPKYS